MAKAWGRKPITVVFVERVPWGGGAERVVIDVARHLDKRRFRALVVCLYEGKEAPRHLVKNIPFVKLTPGSMLDLVKAALSGHLGSELYPEFKLVAKPIQFRLEFRLGNLKVHIGNVKHRTRLRLHNLRAAWATGQSSNYFKERICKWLGVPYLGQPFVYPTDLPPSATVARLRILTRRLRLRTLFGNTPQALEVDRPPVERGGYLPRTAHLFPGRTEISLADAKPPMGVATGNERALQRIRAGELHSESMLSTSICCLRRRPVDIWRQARLFAAFSNTLRGPVVIVAVMEEAASMVRLALGEGPRARWPYVVSTHAWESYYLPLYACQDFDVTQEIALSPQPAVEPKPC